MGVPWESLGWTALFVSAGLFLMFIGLLVFDWLVPFKLFDEVHAGNDAAGWLVAGFLISTGIVLENAFRHNTGLLQGVIYAGLGIILNYLGYFAWEWLTPRWSLNDAIKKNSPAAGKVMFGIFVAIGLVIAGSFS